MLMNWDEGLGGDTGAFVCADEATLAGDSREGTSAPSDYEHVGICVDKPSKRLPPELWWRVYDRDHRRCIAPQLDPEVNAAECRDRWGNPVTVKRYGTTPYDLTFAHIKRPPDYLRVTDEQHAVACCWEHHVMGRGPHAMWITSKRGLELVRKYLEELYGQGDPAR